MTKTKNKVLIILLAVLIMTMPIMLAGCSLFGSLTSAGIKIHTNFKTEYEVGEALDVSNGKITYTDKSGKETIVAVDASMITSFSTENEGHRDMILTYKGETITIAYNVTIKNTAAHIGMLYWNYPAQMSSSGYDYIYFKAQNQICLGSTDSINLTANPAEFFENETHTYTPFIEVINHKTVYKISNADGSGLIITITALDNNQLNCKVTDSTNTINYDINFVEYVARV